jgi:hypothetical protein
MITINRKNASKTLKRLSANTQDVKIVKLIERIDNKKELESFLIQLAAHLSTNTTVRVLDISNGMKSHLFPISHYC